jgi:hypothetical protein
MCPIKSTEQRHHVRYRPKDTLLAAIQGDYCDNPACIVDLNKNGIGFYSLCKESELTGKYILLDLISDGNRAILKSLSGRVVFTCATSKNKNDPKEAPKRYGLQFVNLSTLEKRLLDLITKKYALPE